MVKNIMNNKAAIQKLKKEERKSNKKNKNKRRNTAGGDSNDSITKLIPPILLAKAIRSDEKTLNEFKSILK